MPDGKKNIEYVSLVNTSVIGTISNEGVWPFLHFLHQFIAEMWCQCFVDDAGSFSPGTPTVYNLGI